MLKKEYDDIENIIKTKSKIIFNNIAKIRKDITKLTELKQHVLHHNITPQIIENNNLSNETVEEIANVLLGKQSEYTYKQLLEKIEKKEFTSFYNDETTPYVEYFELLKSIFDMDFAFPPPDDRKETNNIQTNINNLINNVCPDIKTGKIMNQEFIKDNCCYNIFKFNKEMKTIKGVSVNFFGNIQLTFSKLELDKKITAVKTWFYGHQIFFYLFTTNLLDKYLKNRLDEVGKDFISELETQAKIQSNLNKITNNKRICNDRLEEGNYINQTLRFLRQDIRKIMNIKNKSTLYYSPNFVYDCLEDYCISQSDCFNIRSNEELSKFTCPMIDWVFNRQKDAKNAVDISDFSKKIIFGIFCVMNITPGQNEPPPIPYIDINEMKKYSNNWNVDYLIKTASESNQIIITYTNKYAMAVVIYGLERTKRLLNYYREKTKEILLSQIYENVFGKYEMVTDDTNKDKLNNILTRTQTDITEKDMTELKNNKTSGSYVNMIDIFNNIESGNTNYANYGNLKTAFSNFKKLSDAIDNINASSTIGTLEFVDQFAKLNSVSVLCKTKELKSVSYKTDGV